MKVSLFAFITVISAASALAQADNFGGQTLFEAVSFSGQLRIVCDDPQEGRDFAHVDCQETNLEPFEYAYFYTDAGIDANSITLKSVWENGAERKKTVGYDPETGRSQSRVNLWIATLTQRALLAVGANQIHYKLKKDGVEVKRGQFTVNVLRGEGRRCRMGYYASHDSNDCRFPERLCPRYFANKNYCD